MMNVEEYQHHLAALGYYKIAVDGHAGPGTRAAIRQFQTEHKHRKTGDLWADGIWGPKTEAALREVIYLDEKPQVKAPPRPAEKPEPASPDGQYRWLRISQIRCQCGGRYCHGLPDDREFSRQTLEWANQIGRHFGVIIDITSGYRCPRHNAEVSGASPRSRHMQAQAIDLKVKGHTPEEVYAYADRLIGNRGGVGIYRWGIHIDSRGFNSRWDYR